MKIRKMDWTPEEIKTEYPKRKLEISSKTKELFCPEHGEVAQGADIREEKGFFYCVDCLAWWEGEKKRKRLAFSPPPKPAKQATLFAWMK